MGKEIITTIEWPYVEHILEFWEREYEKNMASKNKSKKDG